MRSLPANSMGSSRSAGGFTLVELLISLTIGLVLTIVVAQLFIGSRRTYATTDDVARMQENMRFVNQLVTRTVHAAGYKSAPNTKTDVVFGPPNNLALNGVENAGAAPDEFTVSYQGSNDLGVADGSVVNCFGARVAAGVTSTNRFRIETAAGVPRLVCYVDGGAVPREILPDVDNMKILYGEDINGDGSADRFVTRLNVTNIDNVVALRIAMLFRTPNLATMTAPNTTVYTLNGQPLPAFNDTRARRDMVFTANVRNRAL